MGDPIEILARALAEPFGTPPMDDDYAKARALLPKLTAAAVAQEREACANVADKYANMSKSNEYDMGWCRAASCIALAIRQRGQEGGEG